MSYNSDEYYRSKAFKQMLLDFQEAEKNNLPIMLEPEDYVDIAEYYYNRGQVDYAQEISERAIDIYPGELMPLLFRARMELTDFNNPQRALFYAEQINDKFDTEYIYIMSEIMLAQGMIAEADDYLEEKYAGLSEETQMLFAIDVAGIFSDYNLSAMAEKWLNRSDRVNADDYKEQKARIHFDKGQFDECEKIYNELIDNDPFSTQYWNALASSQFLSNKIQESIQSSDYSLAINPENAAALLNKGNGMYNLGNYKEALHCYKKYVETNSDDESAHLLIGCCYMLDEKYEKAIEHFERAYRLSTKDSPYLLDIFRNWAMSLCKVNRKKEGFDMADMISIADCDEYEQLVFKGSLYAECGDLEESNKCYFEAIEKSHYSPGVFMRVCIAIFDSGDMGLAYQMFKSLFTTVPDWNKGYAYMATCCFYLKRIDEFLEYLKLAVEHTPEETKTLLGHLFPVDMEPIAYYDYMIKFLEKYK